MWQQYESETSRWKRYVRLWSIRCEYCFFLLCTQDKKVQGNSKSLGMDDKQKKPIKLLLQASLTPSNISPLLMSVWNLIVLFKCRFYFKLLTHRMTAFFFIIFHNIHKVRVFKLQCNKRVLQYLFLQIIKNRFNKLKEAVNVYAGIQIIAVRFTYKNQRHILLKPISYHRLPIFTHKQLNPFPQLWA